MPVLGAGLNYIRTDRTSMKHIHSVVARRIGLVARGVVHWLLSDSSVCLLCPRQRILKSSTMKAPDVRLPYVAVSS